LTLTSPTCQTIEVSIGENGKIVVLRQTGTDGDAREQHDGATAARRAPRPRSIRMASTGAATAVSCLS